jgi:hypothetical protein
VGYSNNEGGERAASRTGRKRDRKSEKKKKSSDGFWENIVFSLVTLLARSFLLIKTALKEKSGSILEKKTE